MSEDWYAAPQLPDISQDPQRGNGRNGGNIEVRTANANLGAIRVAVPRHFGNVLSQIEQAAQIFGHRWEYSIPFKSKDKKTGLEITQLVTGPTIGCALDVARSWGNCSVACGEIQEVGRAWVFPAVFLDIETGFQIVRPFRQRMEQNVGGYGGDKGRAEDIVFQIGASKAMRNVVVNALRGVVDQALDYGKNAVTRQIKARPDYYRTRILERLEEFHINPKRVHQFYRKPVELLEAHHMAQIIKMLQAINEGLISPDDFCPEELRPTNPDAELQSVKDADDYDDGPVTDRQPEKAKVEKDEGEAPAMPKDDAPKTEAKAETKADEPEAGIPASEQATPSPLKQDRAKPPKSSAKQTVGGQLFGEEG